MFSAAKMLALLPLMIVHASWAPASLAERRPLTIMGRKRVPASTMNWVYEQGLDGDRPVSLLDKDGDGEITKEELDAASLRAIMSETDLYKELSRQTRLDVYDYESWRSHRSSTRLFDTLKSMFRSRVTLSTWKEISACVLCTFSLWLWNDGLDLLGSALSGTSLAISGAILARPRLMMSMWPWSVTSSFVSLLLVFRTNAAYSRWNEARVTWGTITNTCRDLCRQVIWQSDVSPSMKRRVISRCAAFPHALAYHVGEQTPRKRAQLAASLQRLVGNADTDAVLGCKHKPVALLGLLSQSVGAISLPDQQRAKLDECVSILMEQLGKSERLFRTPIPRVYTRHTARFLATWLFSLPLGVYSAASPRWALVPAMAFIALFVLGIEELSNVLEEPFSILPLGVYNRGIEASVVESLPVPHPLAFTHALTILPWPHLHPGECLRGAAHVRAALSCQ